MRAARRWLELALHAQRHGSADVPLCKRAPSPLAVWCAPAPAAAGRFAMWLVLGKGRGVSGCYGGRDEACPATTGEGTRRVRLVRGEGRDASG